MRGTTKEGMVAGRAIVESVEVELWGGYDDETDATLYARCGEVVGWGVESETGGDKGSSADEMGAWRVGKTGDA